MAADQPAIQDIPRPRPAIPGFMLRLFAFIIDLVLLYFLGYTLATVAREPLMGLGPALPLLGSVTAFLYFWLADSPFGGGSTLGKGIVNIHTVNAFGEPIGWGASLRRALLKFPWVFPALFNFIADVSGAPIRTAYYIQTFMLIICQIIVFTLAYMVVTEPFRRGWHDFLAGSFVTGNPTPDEFRRRIAEPEDGELVRSETTRKMSFALVILIGLLMLGSWGIGLFKKDLSRQLELRDFGNKMELLPGFRLEPITPDNLSGIELPTPEREKAILAEVERVRRETPAGQDAPTTDSLRKMMDDVHTAFLQFTPMWGDLTRDRVESPEFKAGLERIRAEWPRIQAEAKKSVGSAVRVDTIAVVVGAAFHFFLLPHRSEHVLIARMSLTDPSAPIETEWRNLEEEMKKAREERQKGPGAPQAPSPAAQTAPTSPTLEKAAP